MSGTIILTGAAGGMASIYAKLSATSYPENHLILLVRDPAKVKPDLLPSESNHVHILALDMCDIAATHATANRITEKILSNEWPPIAALVCSAAVQITGSDQPRTTADGYEETIAVNHLAHYILIRDLLPHMSTTGRVIIVGSAGHKLDYKYWPKPAVYKPLNEQIKAGIEAPGDGYANGMQRYGNSKMAQMMTGHELFRRLQDHPNYPTHVLMLDPGSMATGLFRNGSALTRMMLRWSLRRTTLINWIEPGVQATLPEDSAAMLLRLTTDPKYLDAHSLTPNRAPYWFASGEMIETYGTVNDEEACKELWTDTANLLGYSLSL